MPDRNRPLEARGEGDATTMRRRVIDALDGSVQSVMLSGHHPGLGGLADHLAARRGIGSAETGVGD